ncbi:hypothetical protein NPIL_380831 [Nephila pilipes]|uniref:Uncharacterized protein n=1 Tax=Nephila pilipes TaxID=299642 RepID=A0A8X6MSM9_NEPPI|nr:hypothetical protein NPIL_380831 [Nephila pilipes]
MNYEEDEDITLTLMILYWVHLQEYTADYYVEHSGKQERPLKDLTELKTRSTAKRQLIIWAMFVDEGIKPDLPRKLEAIEQFMSTKLQKKRRFGKISRW